MARPASLSRTLTVFATLATFAMCAGLCSSAAATLSDATFAADGTLRLQASPPALIDPANADAFGWAPRDADDISFGPNVRVDDDINVEHREPAVAWGPAGAIYATYCERATHWNPERVMFTVSHNAGTTWLAPAVLINDTAPNAVLAQAIGVMADGTIGVAWTEMKFSPYNYEIRFSRSIDGGTSWSPSVVVHPLNPSVDYSYPSLIIIGPRILISYWQETSYPNGLINVVHSDDAGLTWSTPVLVSTLVGTPELTAASLSYHAASDLVGLVMLSASDHIVFFTSPDHGETWAGGVQIDSGSFTSIGSPDVSYGAGFFNVVWNDNRSGQYDSNIWFGRSADGITFTPNVRVNDTFAGNQYEPHINVDDAGNIHVCWIWNLPFQGNIDAYYSVSTDGGAIWLTTCPRVNEIPYVVQPYVSWTTDILADATGDAYVFWNDGRTSGYYDNVYMSTTGTPAAITCDGQGGADGNGSAAWTPFAGGRGCLRVTGQPGEAPILELRLTDSVGDVRIDLFDLNGRWLAPLATGPLATGAHALTLTSAGSVRPLASGAYFVRVTAPGGSAGRHVMIIR
jgi:hypothetical protein